MTEPAYPVARAIAPQLERHFARHLTAEHSRGGQDLASPPPAEAIEAVIDAAFWASLRREEKFPPTISLAYLPPEQAERSIRFEQRLPLCPDALTRLAPAVERPGIHLGVWREAETFYVWGATRTLPTLCFVLEVIAPGLLVIKHRRSEESGKFLNVAVLEGDQIKVLDHQSVSMPDCPPLVASLLGFDSPGSSADSVHVLIRLAVSMRAHGRGGAMLVVPQNTPAWRESIIGPISYAVMPAYSELSELLREDLGERGQRRWQDALRRAIDVVAGLTAVDGAMVLTDQCELLAFGAKIGRREGSPQVERVLRTEPIEGAAARVFHPGDLGGTRHLSAAQFGHDQRDSVALVASQDGGFTVFAWSPRQEMVHAFRIETLLL